MKTVKTLLPILVLTIAAGNTTGDTILDSGLISAVAPSGGGVLAGTSNFNVANGDIPDIILSADFDLVDAGIDIVVNGTALFPQFDDVSQFGTTPVFGGTGIGGGGVEDSFDRNVAGLPRIRVEASSDGVIFTGAETTSTNALINYIPQFTTQDFNNLLVDGDNEIQFFVLNSFEGAALEGDFTVTRVTPVTAVPEPGLAGIAMLVLLIIATYRHRR